ncbi:MAG TPA: DinB family protein [Chloroflexota bacterium]|nr:DinB family protein [Chloroflexota bacterium]
MRRIVVGEIQELFAYNRWANHRLLQAAGALSPADFLRGLGGSFPSVQATLAHILSAEWIWLQRWLGNSPPGLPATWGLASYEALRVHWIRNEQAQLEFVAGLSDDALQPAVSYRTTAGESFKAPLWQLMRHVVNHSSYHRGQMATLLRQLGTAAPGTDLVLFYRETSGPSRVAPAEAG